MCSAAVWGSISPGASPQRGLQVWFVGSSSVKKASPKADADAGLSSDLRPKREAGQPRAGVGTSIRPWRRVSQQRGNAQVPGLCMQPQQREPYVTKTSQLPRTILGTLKLPEAVRAEYRLGDVTHGRTAGQGLVARREDPSIRRVETGWVTGPMGARRG